MVKNCQSYEWVDPQRKIELIRRVRNGEQIKAAANELHIRYSNAKAIV